MKLTDQQIIDGIKSRLASDRWGIGTARQYLASIEPCFAGGGLCPTEIFGKASPEVWTKALEDAAGVTTYCDPLMLIDSKGFKTSGLSIPNSLIELSHVLTTKNKDRDGDIMEPSGATIDESMPLLWQHVQMSPIGRYVETTHRDFDIITGKSVILDTSLGRDAAVLVEGGALRISHGFKAYEGEQLVRKDAADITPYGWHIKKFGVMEVSLVSIPSNADAVITAYSKQKLFNPLVKNWAGGLHDARQKIFAVGVTIKPDGSVDGGMVVDGKVVGDGTKAAACGCGAGTKSGDVVTGSLSVAQTGHATNTATGPTHAVCPGCSVSYDMTGVPDGMDLSKMNCMACGKPMSAGKSVGSLGLDGFKAGRVLSAKNYERIKNAHTHLADCMADCDKDTNGQGQDADMSGKDAAGRLLTKSLIGNKSIELSGTKGWTTEEYPEGSYEWVTNKLWQSAKAHLKAKDLSFPRYDSYITIVATFPDSAVISVYSYDRDGEGSKSPCYRIAWSMVDSVPTWSGDPVEVKVLPTVIAKSFELAVKAYGGGRKDLGAGITAPAIQDPVALARAIVAKSTAMGDGGIAALEGAKSLINEALGLLVDQRDEKEMAELFTSG